MEKLLNRALDLANLRGARYADARLVHNHTQSVAVKDGLVETLSSSELTGFGVRVLVGNAWGFASSQDLAPSEIDRVADLAVKIARASASVTGEPVILGPPVASQGIYCTPLEIEPFQRTP